MAAKSVATSLLEENHHNRRLGVVTEANGARNGAVVLAVYVIAILTLNIAGTTD